MRRPSYGIWSSLDEDLMPPDPDDLDAPADWEPQDQTDIQKESDR